MITYPLQTKEDERALKARQALAKIISSIYLKVKIIELPIRVDDFDGAVMHIGKKITETQEDKIHVNLSGGVRALAAKSWLQWNI